MTCRYSFSHELRHYNMIHSIPFQFHSIPFHSIPFHSIPFHSIPFHSIASHPIHLIPFHPISFHSISFHSIPCHSIPSHFIPFHLIPLHSTPHHSILRALRVLNFQNSLSFPNYMKLLHRYIKLLKLNSPGPSVLFCEGVVVLPTVPSIVFVDDKQTSAFVKVRMGLEARRFGETQFNEFKSTIFFWLSAA